MAAHGAGWLVVCSSFSQGISCRELSTSDGLRWSWQSSGSSQDALTTGRGRLGRCSPPQVVWLHPYALLSKGEPVESKLTLAWKQRHLQAAAEAMPEHGHSISRVGGCVCDQLESQRRDLGRNLWYVSCQ